MTSGGPRFVKRKQSIWRFRGGFAELDSRTVEAKEERRLIGDLSAHVGRPTVVQQILIKRAARLLLMLGQLEVRLIEGNTLNDLAGRQVMALHNSLRLTLTALGLGKAEPAVPNIADFIGGRVAGRSRKTAA